MKCVSSQWATSTKASVQVGNYLKVPFRIMMTTRQCFWDLHVSFNHNPVKKPKDLLQTSSKNALKSSRQTI